MARLSSELVLSLTDRVSGPARAVGRSLHKMNADLRGYARPQIGYLAEVAGAAALVGPAAAAFATQQTAVAAADFESMLTNIQKKAGATAEQTAKLGEEIKDLATNGQLAVPIEEIAAAYERGAAAGIPLADLREFASLSAQAADAFEMSATDVGNAAAGFSTVLKIPMKDMERYFDLINGLGDSGIADESGIVDYIDRGGAMAKTFGLVPEEIAAIGAALANLKVPAEKAATATNSIFAKLLAPEALSKPAYKAFKKLVGNTETFAEAVDEDASEALVGLLQHLKDLDKATRTGMVADIFGQEHLDTVLQMVEGLDEVRENLAFAAGNSWFGSLDKAYALKLDDFWSQWQIAKNELNKLMIDAGTMSMPALKRGLEGAREMIREIGEGLESFKAQVDIEEVEKARVAISDLATIIGDLLNLDASDSAIKDGFRDLANIVNDVSVGIQKARDAIEAVTDPTGSKRAAREKEARQKAMDAHPGMGRPRSSIPDDKPRRYGGSAFSVDVEKGSAAEKVIDFYSTKEKPAQRAAPVPSPFAPPPQQIPAVISAIGGGQPAAPTPSPALQSAMDQASARTRNFWGGSAKPEIAEPVRQEAAAAQAIAEQAGAAILSALSVTARPGVDASPIQNLIALIDQARSGLSALGAEAEAAARRAGDVAAAARANYRQELDGLHADLDPAGF